VTIEKEVTCIICPIGCKLVVNTTGTLLDVLTGNKCKKGIEYVRNEVFDPRRMLTSSILIDGGEWPLVSVKSTAPVPKDKIFTVLEELHKITIKAPIKSKQIILKNVANTGIDIITTKTVHTLKKQ
jgi:CxxC motif-containing protein